MILLTQLAFVPIVRVASAFAAVAVEFGLTAAGFHWQHHAKILSDSRAKRYADTHLWWSLQMVLQPLRNSSPADRDNRGRQGKRERQMEMDRERETVTETAKGRTRVIRNAWVHWHLPIVLVVHFVPCYLLCRTWCRVLCTSCALSCEFASSIWTC